MDRIYLVTISQTIEVVAPNEDEAKIKASFQYNFKNSEFIVEEQQEEKMSPACTNVTFI